MELSRLDYAILKILRSKNCKDFRFITILTLFWQKCQGIYEKSKKSLFF